MNKSNKELTAEIVCTFIQSWNSNPKCNALQLGNIKELIQTTYDAISSLDDQN
ncbi:hypothetical protein lbkm_0649 [Lachnospiraceae bacterium KM106-2]|nr:hypothetical protein lbkm_0649 [Lachnospiraceae bacterium KM106-2]